MEQLYRRARDRESGFEALYRRHSRPLRRIVAASVKAPEAIVDDACQIAWGQFARRQSSVRREAVLSWLATTASREAIKLTAASQREQSLDALARGGEVYELAQRSPGADELAEQRSRLAEIEALPRRQQQLMWLQGMGFSYVEMAARTGASRRTVERQVLRAKHTLRDQGRAA
jgi:RNA polymerase sigma factor (sigma-70 family)